MRVLEQRRGSCCDGALDHFEECLEVAEQTLRQTSAQEGCEDLFVGRIAQRKRIELVLVHELVEDVGAEHDSLGDAHTRLLLQFLRGFVETDMAQESRKARPRPLPPSEPSPMRAKLEYWSKRPRWNTATTPWFFMRR